jgi:Flp pilus assembly pilin Flp
MLIYGLKRVGALCRRFTTDESGPTATEYAILLALIILGSIGIIGSIGGKFAVLYSIITGALPEGFA